MEDDDDYRYEEWLDGILLQFREEHGFEIAEELETAEMLAPVLKAHGEHWPSTAQVFSIAERRLAEGANEEAIFHAGRALDGYVRSVLTDPIRGVISDRIARSIPNDFAIKENHILAPLRGLEGALPFAAYAIGLLAENPSDAASTSKSLRDLVRGTGSGSAIWSLRNRLFHSPISANSPDAESMVKAVGSLLSWISGSIARQLKREAEEREKEEFSPERLEPLAFLFQLSKLAPTMGSPDYKISVDSVRARTRLDRGLTSLVAGGFVERIRDEIFGTVYRLTELGREYYEGRIAARLDERVAKLAEYLAKGLFDSQQEVIADIAKRRSSKHRDN
jgi:hypothetical protein